MEKFKVCQDFSTKRYPDKDFNLLATRVGTSLSDSTDFPSLSDSGKAITAANIIFGNLLVEMSDPTRQITVQKNQARIDVQDLMKSAALQVQDLSGGNELLIRKSGFDITTRSAPVGVLPQVVNLQAKQGIYTGSLDLRWDALPKAKCYEVRYAVLPLTETTVYQTKIFTKCRGNILDGLLSGNQYSLSVSGIGTDPRRVWSVDVISPYVS